MSQKSITTMLDLHRIPYKIVNGRILADSMEAFTEIFENTVDVTDYTRAQLFAWLGY